MKFYGVPLTALTTSNCADLGLDTDGGRAARPPQREVRPVPQQQVHGRPRHQHRGQVRGQEECFNVRQIGAGRGYIGWSAMSVGWE